MYESVLLRQARVVGQLYVDFSGCDADELSSNRRHELLAREALAHLRLEPRIPWPELQAESKSAM
jgi:hypothetical protein